MRSGTLDLHVLESTLQEGWECAANETPGDETRERDTSQDVVVERPGKGR